MELKITKEPIACGRAIYDSFAEQSIESDILLPDYLPSVMRVMSCKAEPRIMSAACDDRKLTVDGVTLIEIFYSSEEGKMCSIEQKLPFSRSIELKTAVVDPMTVFDARVDYLNCRAVSPQRLDVRGAFTLGIKVLSRFEREIVTEAEGSGIQLKREEMRCVRPLGESRLRMTVREELELGYGKSAALSVIRTAAFCNTADCKIVAGKIVAKSELNLHILYESENDGICSMDYIIPVSQMIDMEGLNEECGCDVRFEPCAVEAVPIKGNGEQNGFSAEITVMVTAKAVSVSGVMAAQDAYSTLHPCRMESDRVSMICDTEHIDGNSSIKDIQELPEGISEIKDVWCEVRSVEIKNTGEGVEAECRAMIRMIALDEQGQPVYYEKASSFPWKRGISGGEALCDLKFTAVGCSYSRDSAGRVDIRVEINVFGTIYKTVEWQGVTALTVEEEQKIQTGDRSALIIYYADEGEDIWNISKRYAASVSAVMEENGMENSRIGTRTMLLIPMA